MTRSTEQPEYHGQDLDAAVKRAKRIGGYVIESTGPESKGLNEERGYWSDPDGMIRYNLNEVQIWP